MAKGQSKPQDLRPIAIYLIKRTEKGREATPAMHDKDQKRVENALKAMGAKCELFRTSGSLYDYVATLRDVPNLQSAVHFASVMEEGGFVTASLLSGFHIFK